VLIIWLPTRIKHCSLAISPLDDAPYGKLNDDTIKSMYQLGIKILSAATFW